MRTLIIGHTGGIGAALVEEARARGDEVTGLARRCGFDLTDEDSVAAALGALEPPFDTILVATGALTIADRGPEKALKQIDPQALADQFALNTIGPALVLKHALRLLPRDRRAVFAALSARVGSISDNGLGGWYGYRASKAALNQILHTAAIEIARTHKHAVCVALHPGTVATRFTADWVAPENATPPREAAARLLEVAARLQPAQSGGFFDYAGREIAW
jgi:NAD(P)-dependent dehydrogenase (short-subunit alcohol dehydrogenase family)